MHIAKKHLVEGGGNLRLARGQDQLRSQQVRLGPLQVVLPMSFFVAVS